MSNDGPGDGRDEAPPPVDPAALPEVLTVREAAQLLRINPATVRKLLREGRLPHALVGGQYRLNKSRLLAWMGGEPLGEREPPPTS